VRAAPDGRLVLVGLVRGGVVGREGVEGGERLRHLEAQLLFELRKVARQGALLVRADADRRRESAGVVAAADAARMRGRH
jgi:hypothetical protein